MSAVNEKSHAFVAGLAASATTGLSALAEAGRAALADLPVPTRKSERWKYSPIMAMLASPVKAAPAPQAWPEDVPGQPGPGPRRVPRGARQRPRCARSLRPSRGGRRGVHGDVAGGSRRPD